MICDLKWATPPLYWFRSVEKQQVKLVENAAKKPINLGKFYVSSNQKFLA
jgi:hypothetical protein